MPTLQEELDAFARIVVGLAVEGEIEPMLMLIEPRRHPTGGPVEPNLHALCMLDVGDGAQQARTARLLVYISEPQAAMVAMEGWTIREGVPPSDRDYKRVMRGEMTPSQLPPAKRGEMLILYGETPDGASEHRLYRIEAHANGRRMLGAPESTSIVTSRFRPLFMVDDALRAVPHAGVDDAVARSAAREAVGRLLSGAPEAGTTSMQHELALEEALRAVEVEYRRRN